MEKNPVRYKDLRRLLSGYLWYRKQCAGNQAHMYSWLMGTILNQ